MPYTLNLAPLDVAGYYSAGFPIIAGSIVNPTLVGGSGAAFDTASTSAATPLTLSFTSAAVPPAGACAVLALDGGTGGDLLRSGVVSVLPPSPGTATVITVPPVPISAATISAAAAGAAIPATAIPYWIRLLSGVLTLGTYIPLVAVLPAPTLTLGTGTIAVAVTGSLAVRVFYFFVRTFTIAVTTTVAPAPSNDPERPSRVLRMPITAASLISSLSALPSGLGTFLSSLIASTVESAVNAAIVSTARTAVAGMGMRLTSSAVICARRVTVVAPAGGGAGGVTLQLAVSDLFGAAIVQVPRTLSVAISPAPRPTTPQTYTVTVTDAASQMPVPMATVTLRNFGANGAATTVTNTTDAAGRTVFAASLRSKVTIVVVTTSAGGRPERERESVVVPPTLTVDAAGYNTVRIVLLSESPPA